MSLLVDLHRRLNRSGTLSTAEYLLLLLLALPSWCFGQLAKLRVWSYRQGLLSSYRAPVPVVSVGNLAAGGTGKTPVVDLLVRNFLERGVKVAVVSRGYGGRSRARVNVVSAGEGPLLEAAVCGDEPLLLARRNPRALVITARCRREGVRHAVENLGARVVILDDGFQHLAVGRDLDLLLLDASRPFGNGLTLPAGSLREFPSAHRRADLLLLTNSGGADALSPLSDKPLLRLAHRLAQSARSLDGATLPLASLAGQGLFAFSGIAHPPRFFEALEGAGLKLSGCLELPDHAPYTAEVKNRIARRAKGADFLVTTEKDGVKLAAGDFPCPCLQVPLELEILSGREILDQRLSGLLKKGDSMDLSEKLLEILACPQCKGSVVLAPGGDFLVCSACAVQYPVRDGIPVMLVDEAVPLTQAREDQ